MKNSIFVFILLGLIFAACSSTQQTTEQKGKEEEIYVFDDANVKQGKDTIKAAEKIIPKEETKPVEQAAVKEMPVLKGMNYIVQLGAFSAKDKAEKFVLENKGKLEYEMHISYREAVKLFVVQIPPFSTREEAEKVRNKLWENASFKDAFILMVEKN